MNEYLMYLPNYSSGERRDMPIYKIVFARQMCIWLDEANPGMQLWWLPGDVVNEVEPEPVEAIEKLQAATQTPRVPGDYRIRYFRVFEITLRGLFGHDRVLDIVYVPTEGSHIVSKDVFDAAIPREIMNQLR